MRSLRTYITPDRVANEVLMTRSLFKGAYLLTEGDDDVHFFSQLSSPQKCKIRSLNSKGDVKTAIEILNKRNAKGILAIVDPDYWLADEVDPKIDNLVFGSEHDLDVLLFLSPALEKVVCECLPSKNYDKTPDISSEVRSLSFKLGAQIGLMRWTNERLGLDFTFKQLPYERFCDFNSITLHLQDLYNTLTAPPYKQKRSKSEILSEYSKLESKNKDAAIVSQGHDLANLMEHILPSVAKKHFGNDAFQYAEKRIRNARFSMMLRLAFENKYFSTTDLAKRIKIWEKGNSGYEILAV